MSDDPGNPNPLKCTTVSKVARTNHDVDVPGDFVLNTMGGGEHPSGGNQCASAKLGIAEVGFISRD